MKSRHLARKGGVLLLRKGTNFLLRNLLKALVIIVWKIPGKLYGRLIVLGFYGGVLGALGLSLEVVELTDFLWYAGVWLFIARWRWNWQQLHRGIRPLF